MRFILFIMFVILCTTIQSIVLEVPNDYNTIQSAINAASESDTVLVSPGTYFENINFNGKNITVTSLFLTNGDSLFIDQTVIDGNQNGSVAAFQNQETEEAVLCGFTITNGKGSSVNVFGGNYYYHIGNGIYCIWNSNPTLKNLKIINNSTQVLAHGGGLYVYDSCPKLIDSIIAFNDASNYNGNGGGIFCIEGSIELNNVNIYSNIATYGAGIYLENSIAEINNSVIELNNSIFFGGGIHSIYSSELYMKNVTVRYNTADVRGGGICNSVDSNIIFDNIYLNNIYSNKALDGMDIYNNNTNLEVILDTFTVLYPTSYYTKPLQNFSFNISNYIVEQIDADLYVSPDGDNSNIGTSPEFPLKNIDYAQAIIKVEDGNEHNIYIGEGEYSSTSNNEIYPINLVQNVNYIGDDCTSTILDGNLESRLLIISEIGDVKLTGITIKNGFHESYAGGLYIRNSCPEISNVIFNHNVISSNACSGDGAAVYLISVPEAIFYNVTFAENYSPCPDGSVFISISSKTIILNSIFWDCTNNEIKTMFNPSLGNESELIIDYSNIYTGENSIINNSSNLYYLNSNISIDPEFVNAQEDDYSLMPDSPCIDQGTAYFEWENDVILDIPENYYFGYAPDMGAFEYGFVGIDENNIVSDNAHTQLTNYPNPFNPCTTISFSLNTDIKENTELEIYNLKGQKVKTLPVVLSDAKNGNKGNGFPIRYSMIWNGDDDNNKAVSNGIYFAKLKAGNTKLTRKMILLK